MEHAFGFCTGENLQYVKESNVKLTLLELPVCCETRWCLTKSSHWVTGTRLSVITCLKSHQILTADGRQRLTSSHCWEIGHLPSDIVTAGGLGTVLGGLTQPSTCQLDAGARHQVGSVVRWPTPPVRECSRGVSGSCYFNINYYLHFLFYFLTFLFIFLPFFQCVYLFWHLLDTSTSHKGPQPSIVGFSVHPGLTGGLR